MFAGEQKREDIAMAREQWQVWQQSCDLSKLVFLDETGLSNDMIRRYGRCQDSAPGDIVICDNLTTDKVADVQGIIEAQGATLKYLPPYSPDLNPIEQVFAKLKALLRKAAERTYENLWRTTSQLLD